MPQKSPNQGLTEVPAFRESFLHLICNLPSWSPALSLSNILIRPDEQRAEVAPEIIQGSLIEPQEYVVNRIRDLLFDYNLSDEFGKIMRGYDSLTLQLIRLLAFFPDGIPLKTLARYGFSQTKIDTLLEARILYSSMVPRADNIEPFVGPLSPGLRTVSVYFPWAFLFYFIYPLKIPARRLSLPLALLLQNFSPESIERAFNNLLISAEKLASSSEHWRPMTILYEIYEKMNSGSEKKDRRFMARLIGLRILLGLGLLEFFRQLSSWQLLNKDWSKQGKLLYDNCELFADDQEERQSPWLLWNKNQTDQHLATLVMETPRQIWKGHYHYFETMSKFLVKPSNDNQGLVAVSQQMAKLRQQYVFMLFFVHYFQPRTGQGVPDINYFPLEGKWSLSMNTLRWLVQFSGLLEFFRYRDQSWHLDERAMQLDNYQDHEIVQAFFQFLMWHPGLHFLPGYNDIGTRKQEQLKQWLLPLCWQYRGRTLSLDAKFVKVLHPEPGQSKLLSKLLADLLHLLVELGLVSIVTEGGQQYKDRSLPIVVYVSVFFPPWSLVGGVAESIIQKEQPFRDQGRLFRKTILFDDDFSFMYRGGLLRDIIFISQWASLYRFQPATQTAGQSALFFKLERTYLEGYLAKGKAFLEIDQFMSENLDGRLGSGFQVIYENQKQHSSPLTVWQENSVIHILDAKQGNELLGDENIQKWLTKTMFLVNGGILLLIPPSQLSSCLAYLESLSIKVVLVRSTGLQKQDRSPVQRGWIDKSDNYQYKGLFVYWNYWVERLMHFFSSLPGSPVVTNGSTPSEDSGLESIRNTIEQAISKDLRVQIFYYAKYKDYRGSQRIVRPYKLEKDYFAGYCFLREADRMFSLNRIGSISLIK